MRPLGGHRRGAVLRPVEPRGSGVSPDWPLMRHILALLSDEDGLADAELAEPLTEVRQAARILYRQRRVDMCAGYMVAVPSRVEGRRAA